MTSNIINVPGTIPDSINAQTNYTYSQNSDSLLCSYLNIGSIVITNSTSAGSGITGVTTPTASDQAVNKAYVDSILKVVNDPVYSIQLNADNTNFTSSAYYTYNPTNSTLTMNNMELTDGSGTTLSITGAQAFGIGDLSTQTTSTLAVSKEFVNSTVILTDISDDTTDFTYVPLLRRYTRNPSSDSSDSFADPGTIYAASVTAITPASFPFIIDNVSDYTISLSANGNTIYPSLVNSIPGNSLLKGLVSIVSSSSVNIFIENIYQRNNPMTVLSTAVYVPTLQVTNKMTENNTIVEITSVNYTYTSTDIINIIHRNANGTKTDSFVSPSNLYNGSFYVTIKNTSTTGSIIINNNNGWTLDPYSDVTIPVGYTALLLLNVSGSTGTIYMIYVN